jgi:hypothetical protein
MIQETSAQDLARKQIEAAFAADWPALERLYAHDVQYRDPDTRLSSRAAVLGHLRGQAGAFADFDHTIRACLQRQRRRGRRDRASRYACLIHLPAGQHALSAAL